MIYIVDFERGETRRAFVDKVAEARNAYVRRADEIVRHYRSDEDLDLLADAIEKASREPRDMVLDGWLDAACEKGNVSPRDIEIRRRLVSMLAFRCGGIFCVDGIGSAQNMEHLSMVSALRRENAKGVGNPLPQAVIIGDKHRRGDWRGLPFSGSAGSHLLMNAIRGLEFCVYLMYLDEESKGELQVLRARHNPPPIISVGKFATKRARDMGFVVTEYMAPQECLRSYRSQIGKWAFNLRNMILENQ